MHKREKNNVNISHVIFCAVTLRSVINWCLYCSSLTVLYMLHSLTYTYRHTHTHTYTHTHTHAHTHTNTHTNTNTNTHSNKHTRTHTHIVVLLDSCYNMWYYACFIMYSHTVY